VYKKIEVLEEKLVRATKTEITRLSRQINENPELHRMLTTPMEDIPQYQYLYSLHGFGQHCLFDAIQLFDYERRSNFYFSKIGNEFTGFIVYEDNGKVIDRIKMASFRDDQTKTNPAFAKDLIEFILEMAPHRNTIEWLADPKNIKAIRQYNTLLDRKGFNWRNFRDDNMIKYVVQGLKA
jgi:hypothetical protein